MRIKRDYMGNDQLLPSYNIQLGICDEYIAVCDVKQYASDMDCFIPLMEKFKSIHGFYPKYPVADAGYGSFNNYLYCEEHHMEKYMKFTMFEKESKDEKYRDNPYRAVNFPINENGSLFVRMEKSLIIFTQDLSKETNTAERKNIINARTVQNVLIKRNAVNLKATE